MQKQFEILNDICKIFYENLFKFDKIIYVYKFNPEEDWVGTRMTIFLNEEKIASNFSSEIKDRISNLSQKLHDEMQSHTGGDWRKFTLTINEERKAKTEFIYEIQSCMDEFKN
ncbi:hypothetical protein [Acinetobacter wuhouensis]|uniref:DUF600 family protein n=1 Tax=Acinetobacter wuhouensis TaxID=1879050 RepID=A0A4Q7AK68_9GAMM|nr:hypothetical protein [Acinetobacter wuhouensis]RZG46957.1 hypothetical protein EXU28_07130 [Acinetobacter wuhouensis]RZG71857.1 hypothetical protein EXU29_12075 [Acinetobacter wuhouensis]